MTKLEELFKLIKENPHLPIVPMVDSEIVADDGYSRWLGEWGYASIDKYYRGEERIYFYDEYDMEDVLVEVMGWDKYDEATDEECIQVYRSLPWIEAIVVNIDLPS